MNIKVIIVWGLAVLIFAGIGLFGYLNQNLLYATDENFTPKNDTEILHTCKSTLEFGESLYRFSVKDEVIDRLAITYKSTTENIELYESASNINRAIMEGINGVTSAMSGGIADFSLTINVNVTDYDKEKIEEMTNDFTKLLMVIDSISSYDVYNQALAQLNTTYTCE